MSQPARRAERGHAQVAMDTFFGELIDRLQSLPAEALTAVAIIGLASLLIGLLIGFYWSRWISMRRGRLRSSRSRSAFSESARIESERLRAIYNLTSTLSATLNYQHVLEKTLDLSGTALSNPGHPTDHLVSAVLMFSGSELEVGSARRFTRSDKLLKLPGNTGIIGRTFHYREPQLSRSPAEDPELGRFIVLRSCKSVFCLPLRSGLDTYGLLLFAHPDGEYFTPDRREVLEIIGTQTIIAIQNARLYQALEQEKERMMEIQDEARKKLARDLHDGPTQSVAAIAMRINFARRLMDRNRESATLELHKIEDLARRTTKEIRHMLFTLRPLILESQGLVAALESMADKMRETYNQQVVIDADAAVVSELEIGKQAVIFYIVEEGVNNARKHAQAPHVWVRLKSAGKDIVLLEIEDDGVGFNVGEVDASYEHRGSLGMVNMRERGELINGILQIDSTEGKGTCIQLWIPLTEEAADRIHYGQ